MFYVISSFIINIITNTNKSAKNIVIVKNVSRYIFKYFTNNTIICFDILLKLSK